MKLINSKVEIVEQDSDIAGIYKQIELAGRTCYKSEDKITEDSAKEFVDRMIKSGHGAMLEHGTVYLTIPITDSTAYRINSYRDNKYTKTRLDINRYEYYITTNMRVLVENGWLDDLKYISEPTTYHKRRFTVRFTCDRGVSHELVRHRAFSFAMESTRYCNYSKDKFGNELAFIIPSTWLDTNTETKESFINFLKACEDEYFTLLMKGWKPQQARQILPNALKTEVIVTGFEDDWKHFFELRCATVAHPDIKKLALDLRNILLTEGDCA